MNQTTSQGLDNLSPLQQQQQIVIPAIQNLGLPINQGIPVSQVLNVCRTPQILSVISNNNVPPPPPTTAALNLLCSVNGSGNYLGYAGMDTQSLTKPTRYYNKSECEELKGTFQKIPDNYVGKSSKEINSTTTYNWSNRFNVGTCVRPNLKGKTVDLSSTCATLPTNYALNMRSGNMIPAQGTIYGKPRCKHKGTLFIMDQNGALRCTGDPVTADDTNNNIMLA